jgi:hypothetical protein
MLNDCSDKRYQLYIYDNNRMNVVLYIIITRMNVVDNLNSV